MKYAYEATCGTRRILGTDHPIRIVVYRANRQWVVATIVNGIAESSKAFHTLNEAMAYARRNQQ